MKAAILLLYNSKIKKDEVNGRYEVEVRCPETKQLIESYAEKNEGQSILNGYRIEVKVVRPPRFFKDKEEYFETILQENELLKEFKEKLGLKLIW